MLTLDVGCGFRKGYHPKQGQIGIDLNRGTCDIRASAEALPFRDGMFAHVIIDSVLEHLPHPLVCLQEIRRVLQVGGVVKAIFPVQCSLCRNDLAYLVSDFPFSIPSLFKLYYNFWLSLLKGRKGMFHIRDVKPDHVGLFFQNVRVSLECQPHSWFKGRKGKVLRWLVGRTISSPAWNNYVVEGRKMSGGEC